MLQYLGQLFIPAIQEATSEIALLASTLQMPFSATPANLMSPILPEIIEWIHTLAAAAAVCRTWVQFSCTQYKTNEPFSETPAGLSLLT